MNRKTIAVMLVAVLFTSTASADNLKVQCKRLLEQADRKATDRYWQALHVALSDDGVKLPDLASRIFSEIPPALFETGSEYFSAKSTYDVIDAARNAAQAERLKLQADPDEARYRQAMDAEMRLDKPYYRSEARYQKTRKDLIALATAFTTPRVSHFDYDRALAFDDRAMTIRFCAPPRNGFMLDWRFCANYDLATLVVTYGLHIFGSYPIRDPVQSDQVLMLSLGTLSPKAFLQSKENRKKLYATMLEDAQAGLPGGCFPGK